MKRAIGDASDARNSHSAPERAARSRVGEDVEAPGAVGPGDVAELHRLGVGEPDDRRGVEAHPDREALGEVLVRRARR